MISPVRDTLIVIICASLIFILVVLLSLLGEIKQIQSEAISANGTLIELATQQATASDQLSSLLNETLNTWELVE